MHPADFGAFLLRLFSLHNGFLPLVNHHVLLCLVHFHLVQHSLGQQLLEVVPDEHSNVLCGAGGDSRNDRAEMAEMSPMLITNPAQHGLGVLKGMVTPGSGGDCGKCGWDGQVLPAQAREGQQGWAQVWSAHR